MRYSKGKGVRKMTQELDLLKLVCQKLEQAHISYMLTGSLAANCYATPRMTRDIDIVIEILKTDVDTVYQIFQEDFYVDKDQISEAIKYKNMFNIIHNDSVFKVDFIVRKDSLYRTTEFQRKRSIKIDDREIWIVAPEDLIISKLLWAKDNFSAMHINDARNLVQTIKDIDNEYLMHWIKTLQLEQVYEKVTQHV